MPTTLRLIEESIVSPLALVDWQGRAESTALIFAAHRGHHRVVKVLLDARADVRAEDHWGDTALDFAEEEGHDEVINMLKLKLPRRGNEDVDYGDYESDEST